jgi:hypothetical protein
MDKMFHHHKKDESQSGTAKEAESKPSFGEKLKAFEFIRREPTITRRLSIKE